VALASGPAAVAAAGFGSLVKRTRTGWVQRVQTAEGAWFCKTYVYPTARDRWRGLFRTTCLAPSRARREAEALAWLASQGFPSARPVLLAEDRRGGMLHAAVLATEAVEGPDLEQLLPRLAAPVRTALLHALRAFVEALHHRGFRDRNLDLRNLLLSGTVQAPSFVKIDSPRHVVVRRGRRADALARQDWHRLTASLRALGLSWPA
jgi:hypothetical protein